MKLAIAVALFILALATLAEARDNFLVIIADDIGVDGINVYSRDDLYGHLGEGASPGPTPHIDQLAAEGILFRNATTNPVCAPTRAEALTGRYGFRTGIGTVKGAVLELDEITIPELLDATHETAAIGKWHIGGNNDLDHPIDSGFDYYAGGIGGGWAITTPGARRPTRRRQPALPKPVTPPTPPRTTPTRPSRRSRSSERTPGSSGWRSMPPMRPFMCPHPT